MHYHLFQNSYGIGIPPSRKIPQLSKPYQIVIGEGRPSSLTGSASPTLLSLHATALQPALRTLHSPSLAAERLHRVAAGALAITPAERAGWGVGRTSESLTAFFSRRTSPVISSNARTGDENLFQRGPVTTDSARETTKLFGWNPAGRVLAPRLQSQSLISEPLIQLGTAPYLAETASTTLYAKRISQLWGGANQERLPGPLSTNPAFVGKPLQLLSVTA